MSFKGSVESFSLADVFQNLSMNQQTGTLSVVTLLGLEKHIFFKEGHICFLTIGAQHPLMPPEVFVAHGLLLENQLAEAVERNKQTNEGVTACLLALGHLNEAQCEQMFKHQTEEEIYELFNWDKATFEFNEGAPPPEKLPEGESAKDQNLAVSHLIMEAARRVDEWERLRKHVPALNIIYCLDATAGKSIENGEMELEPSEKHLASLLDASRDVADLLANSHLFKFEVLTILAGFIESSLARQATVAELLAADQRCMQQNLPMRRINILERVLALGGENARIREELAGLLAKAQLTERACSHYNVLAGLAMQSNQVDAAVELYSRILAIAPNNSPAHEQLADIYFKRGQKREAFVHFLEVFEIQRDQKQIAAACSAAQRALECDPARLDLRSNLIDLLAADNQKELAGKQLEQLGDLAAKAGNVKLAADSYRRAFQFLPAQKQLKKKMADVMLTKEDRRLRRRKLLAALGICALVLLLAGVLAGKEYLNHQDFEKAYKTAEHMTGEGARLEKDLKYGQALDRYRAAQAAWTPLRNRFSPFLNYSDKARDAQAALDAAIDRVAQAEETLQNEGARRSCVDLEAAQTAWKSQEIQEAKEAFERVLHNETSSEENLKAARTGLEAVQNMLQRLETAKRRLIEDPNKDYENIPDEKAFVAKLGEELAWKKKLLDDFKGSPKLLNPADVKLPLWLDPETDDVQVYLDGKLWGTVKVGSPREQNILRHPSAGSQRLELKRPGYKTITLNTSDLQMPVYRPKLEREPIVALDLAGELGNQKLSGEATLDEGAFLIGTSEGSLLRVVNNQGKAAVQKYNLPGIGGVNREVYGAPLALKRSDKSGMVVYCTKAGDCAGLLVSETGFKEAWSPIKGDPMNPLTAPPAAGKLSLLGSQPLCFLPFGKKLTVVNAETGQSVRLLELKRNITAAPLVLDQNLVVVGCADGMLYGINLSNEIVREWNSNAKAAAIRGKPALFEDQLLACAEDGRLYFFDSKKDGFRVGDVPLEGILASEPLVLKRRLYAGSIQRENFYCVDLATRSELWRIKDTGGVEYTPASQGKRVYFVTQTGRFYAIDADKGAPRWIYQLEAGRRFVSKPLVSGQTVYVFTDNGKILGFDETPEE